MKKIYVIQNAKTKEYYDIHSGSVYFTTIKEAYTFNTEEGAIAELKYNVENGCFHDTEIYFEIKEYFVNKEIS